MDDDVNQRWITYRMELAAGFINNKNSANSAFQKRQIEITAEHLLLKREFLKAMKWIVGGNNHG
jgi:hypothetical protein